MTQKYDLRSKMNKSRIFFGYEDVRPKIVIKNSIFECYGFNYEFRIKIYKSRNSPIKLCRFVRDMKLQVTAEENLKFDLHLTSFQSIFYKNGFSNNFQSNFTILMILTVEFGSI